MIIRSLRLKNIKSYGEGPDGNGVLISFEPGVNRIAGRNGHGKSTLIEALGYALFHMEPQFEENFQTERYLLSHGAREGEIDVVFSHGNETYRVERGIGRQSRRIAKVIQLSDASICAEKDDQVAAFLCRLLQFPDLTRLREMFSKLIGVKQGRLTWPFDSKPAEAKRYFEPLLDVSIFRECFDQLKPAVDIFEKQLTEQERERAALQARLEERADSEAKLEQCRLAVAGCTRELQAAHQGLELAAKLKNELEQLQKKAEETRSKASQCQQTFSTACKIRESAEAAVADSRNAADRMRQNQAAYSAYLDAETALGKLDVKRAQRDHIRAQREHSEAARVRSEAKAAAARNQAAVFLRQKAEKETSSRELQSQLTPLVGELEGTAAAFAQDKLAADQARQHLGVIADFVPRLQELGQAQASRIERARTLTADVASWEPGKLIAAERAEAASQGAYEKAKEELAASRQRLKTLKDQLQQISGGVCPFLKEQCRQFDPARVGSDLESCQAAIIQLQGTEKTTKTAAETAKAAHLRLRGDSQAVDHQRADLQRLLREYTEPLRVLIPKSAHSAITQLLEWERQIPRFPQSPKVPEMDSAAVLNSHSDFARYIEAVNTWWLEAQAYCHRRLESHDQRRQQRHQQEEAIKHLGVRIQELTAEIQALHTGMMQVQQQAASEEVAQAAAARQVAQLDEELKVYGSLDEDLKREQSNLAAARPHHAEYLRAKGLADELTSRLANLERCTREEASAATAWSLARSEEETAAKAFDPERLTAARENFQVKYDAAAQLKFRLDQFSKDLKQAETRFAEWQQLSQSLRQVEREIGRLRAAIELTETARKTLRDTAPEVARHICHRIAERAQRVFNQINPEPVELEWDSEHYSLRVAPGDRRFAMLSGGEQTKLALSMTLAMIEEFSGLRFCIFDEPTYGVDADSRQKLARAILDAQEAAQLEQLLLVSHDDAFEGKIEHSVVLNKSTTGGTFPLPG